MSSIHECFTFTTTDQYAETQEAGAERLYGGFVIPLLLRENSRRVLDAGCGTGRGVEFMREQGIEAVGIDLPDLRRFWPQRRMSYLLTADACDLPFPDDYFDAIIS